MQSRLGQTTDTFGKNPDECKYSDEKKNFLKSSPNVKIEQLDAFVNDFIKFVNIKTTRNKYNQNTFADQQQQGHLQRMDIQMKHVMFLIIQSPRRLVLH
jgi:hypothetical protein